MNTVSQRALFMRLFKMLLVSLSLVGAGLVGAQAASAAPGTGSAAIQAAAPVAQQSPPTVAAVYRCVTVLYRNGLERDCTVSSGYIRSYLTCSNGVTYRTPWLGPGRYYIRQVCPSPYVRTGSGIEHI